MKFGMSACVSDRDSIAKMGGPYDTELDRSCRRGVSETESRKTNPSSEDIEALGNRNRQSRSHMRLEGNSIVFFQRHGKNRILRSN